MSVDGVEDHQKWSVDIEKIAGHPVNYQLIGDPMLEVVKKNRMLPATEGKSAEGRTAATKPLPVFIIGPDKKIKAESFHTLSLLGNLFCVSSFDIVASLIP